MIKHAYLFKNNTQYKNYNNRILRNKTQVNNNTRNKSGKANNFVQFKLDSEWVKEKTDKTSNLR